MSNWKRAVRVLGLFCFVGSWLSAGNLSAMEFGYERIGKDKIEFKAGGEVFLFNGSGGWEGLKLQGKKKTFLATIPYKNRNREPYYIFMKGIKSVETILDNEISKKLKVTLGANHWLTPTFTPTDLFEVEIIFQTYKNIPAISVQPAVRNLSENIFDFQLLWESNYRPAFFTVSIKGKVETKPNLKSEIWKHRISNYVFLHDEEESKEGLGIIAKGGSIVFTPSVYVCSKKFVKIGPTTKTGFFKITYISIKEGYEEIEEINKKIKVLEGMGGEQNV